VPSSADCLPTRRHRLRRRTRLDGVAEEDRATGSALRWGVAGLSPWSSLGWAASRGRDRLWKLDQRSGHAASEVLRAVRG